MRRGVRPGKETLLDVGADKRLLVEARPSVCSLALIGQGTAETEEERQAVADAHADRQHGVKPVALEDVIAELGES